MAWRTYLLLTAGLFLVACQQQRPEPKGVKKAERGPDYRGWRRVTEFPLHLAPQLAMLCRKDPIHDGAPHPSAVFHVYVNPMGKAVMLGRSLKTPFPDGTIIIKEKWSRAAFGANLNTKELPKTEPDLLTMMTKVKGKWKWSVVKNGLVQTGDMSHCAKCHESAKETDYVFRNYLTKS